MTDLSNFMTADGADEFVAPTGQEAAERFEEIYRTHRSELVRYATVRRVDDPEDVADLALLDLYRALDRMRSRHPKVIWSYLYRSADGHIARSLLVASRQEAMADMEPLAGTIEFEDSVIDRLALDELLDDLPPDQGDALRLRLVDRMTSEEAGRTLGKSPSAIRQLQSRGLSRLRRGAYGLAILLLVVGGIVVAARLLRSTSIDNAPADNPQIEDDEPVTEESLDQPVPTAEADVSINESTVPTSTSSSTSTSTSTSIDGSVPPVSVDGPGPDSMLPWVYEGFDLGLGDGEPVEGMGRSALGSDPDSVWTTTRGELDAGYDTAGLEYVDADGRRLRTAPGGVRLTATEPTIWLRSRSAGPEPGETYWVSYLLRLDSPRGSEMFWTNGHWSSRGGFGLQATTELRFANGPSAPGRDVAPGQTVFLVAELRADGGGLWINPLLSDPGAATVDLGEPPPEPTDDILFIVDDVNDGRYTIDELRMGPTFESVAPVE